MNLRILIGVLAWLVTLSFSKVYAQTNNTALTQVQPDSFQGRLIAPFWDQIVNNPASLTVIVFLCVVAFLLDDTPVINSRYVSHIVILLGMSIYWMFAGGESVPKYFPHPFAVLVVNGSVAGLIAATGHRYVIAMLINSLRVRFGLDQVPLSRKFLREPGDPTQLLTMGQSENPPAQKP